MIMLYYRDSFNYQVNLRLVRRLRAHLLRTRAGYKLAQLIGQESPEELQRHAELIRRDPSHLDMQHVLNRNTDGPDNPLSQVFSRVSGRRLFAQFRDVRTRIMFWNRNWLPGIGKVLPRRVENRLASLWGWHLWIFAQKPPAEFAEERAPQPTEPVIHVHRREEAFAH